MRVTSFLFSSHSSLLFNLLGVACMAQMCEGITNGTIQEGSYLSNVSHGEFYKKACSNSSKMCPSVCSFCTPSEYPMECYSRFLLQACLMNFASALSAFNDTCTWNNIRDPYNTFTLCSEEGADCLFIPWPNQHVETVFVWIHRNYFNSCPTVALSDPPSSIIFALVMTPICLIPVMVVLVVMKTKNGDGSS